MKKIVYSIIFLMMLMVTACEYDILESKPGESIDPVTNVNHTVSGTNLSLTWDLPAQYPADIIQPVSVVIRITRDGQNFGTQVLDGAPRNFTLPTYDASKKYKFILKVRGNVDTTDKNFSNLRYSSGVTIEI